MPKVNKVHLTDAGPMRCVASTVEKCRATYHGERADHFASFDAAQAKFEKDQTVEQNPLAGVRRRRDGEKPVSGMVSTQDEFSAMTPDHISDYANASVAKNNRVREAIGVRMGEYQWTVHNLSRMKKSQNAGVSTRAMKMLEEDARLHRHQTEVMLDACVGSDNFQTLATPTAPRDKPGYLPAEPEPTRENKIARLWQEKALSDYAEQHKNENVKCMPNYGNAPQGGLVGYSYNRKTHETHNIEIYPNVSREKWRNGVPDDIAQEARARAAMGDTSARAEKVRIIAIDDSYCEKTYSIDV